MTQLATRPVISWMQSLGDATRTRLLRLLEGRELAVGELCSVLQLPQSTVSRHLRTLTDDGWVQSRREGQNRLYTAEMTEPAKRQLWELVRSETDDEPIARQDALRLVEVLAARARGSQAFFSSAAGHWDHLRNELFGPRVDNYLTAAMIDPRWTVVDLGCGTGETIGLLADHARRVIGVDSSPAMLSAARARLGDAAQVELVESDLAATGLDGSVADVLLMSLVLPYIQDLPAVFTEAARVACSDGRLIIVDLLPHERVEFRSQFNHLRLGIGRDELADMLAHAGWHVQHYGPLPPDPHSSGPNLFLCSAMRRPSGQFRR